MRGKKFLAGATTAVALFAGASCSAGRSDEIGACDHASDSGVVVEPNTVASMMVDVDINRREIRINDPNGWTTDPVDSAGEIACRSKGGDLHYTIGGLAVEEAIKQIKSKQSENN